MIIENRWFNCQFPRRVDLSGRPLGVLFVWLGGVGPLEKRGHWTPHQHAKEFGFFIPDIFWRLRIALQPKYEALDCAQLLDRKDLVPHDWQKWPDMERRCCEMAVRRAVEARPGCEIVRDESSCDRRTDLSGRPLQLYRSIIVKRAA